VALPMRARSLAETDLRVAAIALLQAQGADGSSELTRSAAGDHGQVLHAPPDAELQPSPVSQLAAGHAAGEAHELLPSHVTLQRHDDPQATPPAQLLFPLQVTLHGPEPHVTGPPHEPTALHETTQLVACEQSTRLQSSLLSHRTVQPMPAGHAIAWPRHLPPLQSMVQSA